MRTHKQTKQTTCYGLNKFSFYYGSEALDESNLKMPHMVKYCRKLLKNTKKLVNIKVFCISLFQFKVEIDLLCSKNELKTCWFLSGIKF